MHLIVALVALLAIGGVGELLKDQAAGAIFNSVWLWG